MVSSKIVRRGYADTFAGQVHVMTAGAGAPLVLLPHGGRSARMYRGLIPILARRCRVIALDPPGTGESLLPERPLDIPDLAEILHEAAAVTAGGRYTLFGMNGGNKLGAAIAAAHPLAVTGFLFAGLTHSIVLSNERRQRTLGEHPAVHTLDSGAGDASPSDWIEQARAATAFPPDRPADQAIDEAVDRLQAIRYRRSFYRAVTAYDLEHTLRSLSIPLAVLEFATADEDARIGRQGPALAAELGAAAHSVIELHNDAPVSLEDRPHDLAAAILSLWAALSPDSRGPQSTGRRDDADRSG